MDGMWDDYYSIDVPIAFGAALFTALAVRFKAWVRGDAHEDAPLVRQFFAYLLAYLVGLAAVRGLDGMLRYAVMIAAAALAVGVTINGRKPLNSGDYARNVGIAFCGILVLLAIYGLLTALGCDLSKDIGV